MKIVRQTVELDYGICLRCNRTTVIGNGDCLLCTDSATVRETIWYHRMAILNGVNANKRNARLSAFVKRAVDAVSTVSAPQYNHKLLLSNNGTHK